MTNIYCEWLGSQHWSLRYPTSHCLPIGKTPRLFRPFDSCLPTSILSISIHCPQSRVPWFYMLSSYVGSLLKVQINHIYWLPLINSTCYILEEFRSICQAWFPFVYPDNATPTAAFVFQLSVSLSADPVTNCQHIKRTTTIEQGGNEFKVRGRVFRGDARRHIFYQKGTRTLPTKKESTENVGTEVGWFFVGSGC